MYILSLFMHTKKQNTVKKRRKKFKKARKKANFYTLKATDRRKGLLKIQT